MNTDELRTLAQAATSSMDDEPWWDAETLESGSFIYSQDAAFIAAASPAAVLALLDRIKELDAEVQERILAHDITFKQAMANGEAAALAEAERDEAQAEALEQARLLGMGAERELKLMAERDEARRAVKRLAGCPTDAEYDRATQDPVVRRIVEE